MPGSRMYLGDSGVEGTLYSLCSIVRVSSLRGMYATHIGPHYRWVVVSSAPNDEKGILMELEG